MRIEPKSRTIEAFWAGSRPGRLRKRRQRERDSRRERWFAQRLADDVSEMFWMVA